MTAYEVTVINRGEEWTYACDASTTTEARRKALAFFGAGTKILRVQTVVRGSK